MGERSPVLLTAYVRQIRSAKFAIIFFFFFFTPNASVACLRWAFIISKYTNVRKYAKTTSLFFRLPMSFACYAARCTDKGITADRFRPCLPCPALRQRDTPAYR